MRKRKKSAVILSCILMTIALYTGCGKDKVEIDEASYGKGSRKIYANLLKEYAIFTNVAFYDIKSDRKISSHNGKVYLEGSSYASTELHIRAEKDRKIYWIHTDTALNQFPSSFKLYTNYEKSTYDTYLKK